MERDKGHCGLRVPSCNGEMKGLGAHIHGDIAILLHGDTEHKFIDVHSDTVYGFIHGEKRQPERPRIQSSYSSNITKWMGGT